MALLTAAMLAADLAASVDREVHAGFQQRDVRFFYLLFRNWLEVDVRQPGADLDLTQVRRACEALAARGRLRSMPRRRRGGRTPRERYQLTLAGVTALVDQLVAPSPTRSFEESLFVVMFAGSYRAHVIRRVEQASAPVARKHVARALDPKTIITGLRRELRRQIDDLEERIAGGEQLRAAAERALAEGADDREVARMMERLSTYQLHNVRPLGELLLSLPTDVRRHEMTVGITARRDVIFQPLLELTRAQDRVLAAIDQSRSIQIGAVHALRSGLGSVTSR